MEGQLPAYLAANLIELRRKNQLTQKQLAERADIPRTTLTNMESGAGNPSLSNLARIASALGVGVEELLSRPRSSCYLMPSKDIEVDERSGGKVHIANLLPDRIRGIAIERMEFEPQSRMVGQPHLAGTKEYFHVLSGEFLVYVDGEAYRVGKGDVFAFPGNQPHSYRNKTERRSVAISVVIPVPLST